MLWTNERGRNGSPRIPSRGRHQRACRSLPLGPNTGSSSRQPLETDCGEQCPPPLTSPAEEGQKYPAEPKPTRLSRACSAVLINANNTESAASTSPGAQLSGIRCVRTVVWPSSPSYLELFILAKLELSPLLSLPPAPAPGATIYPSLYDPDSSRHLESRHTVSPGFVRAAAGAGHASPPNAEQQSIVGAACALLTAHPPEGIRAVPAHAGGVTPSPDCALVRDSVVRLPGFRS